jgi:hypothetical protein
MVAPNPLVLRLPRVSPMGNTILKTQMDKMAF